jgi:hypothetical protein
MNQFKKYFSLLLFCMCVLNANAEESNNSGVLSNDDLPSMNFDFGPSADAVAPGGGPGTVPGFDDNTSDVPIDGGISLLLGAGLAYGAAKLRKKNEDSDLYF